MGIDEYYKTIIIILNECQSKYGNLATLGILTNLNLAATEMALKGIRKTLAADTKEEKPVQPTTNKVRRKG